MTNGGFRAAAIRRAGPADATEVAVLLHDFNVEFDTPSPGVAALAARLEEMLAGDGLVALLSEQPDTGVALMSFRPNAWYAGPVGLLDELFVRPLLRGSGIGTGLLTAAVELTRDRGAALLEINVDEPDTQARRFYERHGFICSDPTTGERSVYYWRELSIRTNPTGTLRR